MLDTEIPNEIPLDYDYFEYFCPEYKIHMSISNMENLNTNEELEKTTQFLLQTLKNIDGDSVQQDRSNYKNGGNHVADHMDLDKSKNNDLKEERLQDQNQDSMHD